jgi:protein-L-isoaspartate(D-aspartate) O-methyltransferase
MSSEDPFTRDREYMVESQLEARGIVNTLVLDAMRRIPRHLFVAEPYRHLAYADGPLPIGQGQTISQPYVVAIMTQMLLLEGEEKVLEIGTGSGYQAAILGLLAREVHSIEQHAGLAERAAELLKALQLFNVHIHHGDGSQGLPAQAPFEAILATAAAPAVPKPILAQLADGGRFVLPVGGPTGQVLERWERRGGQYDHEAFAPVAFVPLRGKYGWGEDDWARHTE